uniref:Uncharacterized protein n=1 Tax=Trichogramma kaykai TaxID=54128 RepID=A0ABD2VSI9_9HYME
MEQFHFPWYISSKKFNEKFRYTADVIRGRIMAYLLKKRVNHQVHNFSWMVTLWLPGIRRAPYLFRARAFLKFTAPAKIIRTRATPAALLSRASTRISAATSKAGANSPRSESETILTYKFKCSIHNTRRERESSLYLLYAYCFLPLQKSPRARAHILQTLSCRRLIIIRACIQREACGISQRRDDIGMCESLYIDVFFLAHI